MEMPSIVGDVVRSVGLSTAMRAAGVVTGMLPIPQPLLLVGPGSSARLGQTLCSFRHRKILIVTDRIIAGMGLLEPLTSALFKDEPTIEAMNRIGIDFNAVGNHEFDEGKDELLRMQQGGNHPTDIYSGQRTEAGSRRSKRTFTSVDSSSNSDSM